MTTLCTAWAYKRLTSMGSEGISLVLLNSLFFRMNLFSLLPRVRRRNVLVVDWLLLPFCALAGLDLVC